MSDRKETILTDRSLQPGTPRRANGTVGRLRTEYSQYNRIRMSAQLGEKWANIEFAPSEFETFLMCVESAASAKEAFEESVECTKQDRQSRQQVTVGEMFYGRDADGIVYLKLTAPNLPEQRFDFLPLFQYKWKRNGQPIPNNVASKRNAMAWVKLMSAHVTAISRADFRPSNPQGGGNNFNGNGNYQKKQWGNNNGNNWQGNQQRQQQAPQQQNDGNFNEYIEL